MIILSLDVIFRRIVTSEFTDLYRRRCLLRKLAPDGNTRNSAGCGEHWQEAFANCRSLEGIVFPEGIESVRDGAFKECYGIGSIVCKGEMPAYVEGTALKVLPRITSRLKCPKVP